MAKLTSAAMQELLSYTPWAPAISFYMPTHNAATPPNMSENHLRFKNLRVRAQEIIKNMPEVDLKTGRAVEHELAALQDDLDFWEHMSKGLAIFASPKGLTAFQLPIDCDEYVAVDSRFHVAPLLGLLHDMVEYYVLVISQKDPLLFKGDMYDLRPLNGVKLPSGGTSSSHQWEMSPTGRDSRPQYFGREFPLVVDEERLHFFRAVDRVLRQSCDVSRPLILAGSEPEVEAYRQISSYPHILAGHLAAHNSATNPHELFPVAWKLVQKELIGKQRQETIERYEQLQGGAPERASANLAAIQDAVDKGRIGTLLVKLIRFTTDTIRDNKIAVPKLHFLPDEQMLIIHDIALRTWRASGEVVPLDADSAVPPNAALVAIFRY